MSIRISMTLCVIASLLGMSAASGCFAQGQRRIGEQRLPGPERVEVGVWSLPALTGYERRRSDASIFQTVNYRLESKESRIFLRFGRIHGPDLPVFSLEHEMRDTVRMLRASYPSAASRIRAWRVTFRGIPGYQTEWNYREGGQRVWCRTLRFRDGLDQYMISATVRGNIPEGLARERLDDAWRLLTSGLRREEVRQPDALKNNP